MKLDKLKSKLKFIKRGVRPILVNVKVDENSIECNDLETFVKIKNNYGMKPGLQQFDTLGLVESNQENFDDYPLVEFKILTKTYFETTCEILQDLIKYASKDETRPHLNGVAIDGQHLVATNGHVCKYVEISTNVIDNFIIPRAGIINLIKLLKGFKIKGDIRITLNEEYAVIDNKFFTVKIRLIQRDYVKWQGSIPEGFIHSFVVTDWINLKEIKALFDMRTGACIITTDNGYVVLTPAKYPDNSYIIGVSDLDFEIGFNVNYLDLAAKKDKEFTVKFNNALSPALVNGAIVMPLKL